MQSSLLPAGSQFSLALAPFRLFSSACSWDSVDQLGLQQMQQKYELLGEFCLQNLESDQVVMVGSLSTTRMEEGCIYICKVKS